MRMFRRTWLVTLPLVFMVGEIGHGIAPAQPPQESAPASGRLWVLLIGVENYHKANRLMFTLNDVRELAKTFRVRGGVEPEQILELTDNESNNPRSRPPGRGQEPNSRASLIQRIPEFLTRATPDDRLIVYFTGHGFKGAGGGLFLAPIDCDPAHPDATGIAVAWLRERIAACRAGFKLLILDACHAGSEKGDDPQAGVSAGDLVKPFDDLTSIATLASSTADQKSQIWADKQQSLFSYWLNQGLKGHADGDGDGVVDIDELNSYVHRSVTRTARARMRPQTPVRIVRTGTPGVPEVVKLRPQGLRQVLSDMAEQLAVELEDRRLAKVGVLEFTSISGADELLGADFGLLGRFCSEDLRRRLVDQGDGRFSVIDPRRLQSALVDQKFGVQDLGSELALKQLSSRVGGMPVLAQGTLKGRKGRVVTLQCKLIQTDNDGLASPVGGTAILRESEWAMRGSSVVVQPDDRMPALQPADQPAKPMADQLIERLDERAKGPHPLLDPNFPFRLHFFILDPQRPKAQGQERQGVARGNEWLLPVKTGELFAIDIENRTDQIVCMRLLVDGLNTLPEPETTKGVVSFIWGKPVNLDEARHWVLDPIDRHAWRVSGFTTTTGASGETRQFVAAADQYTLAARRRFTDQIGLITAAFYSPAGGSRGRIGVAAGDAIREDMTEREGVAVGNLIAVVHVRLVEAGEVGVRVP